MLKPLTETTKYNLSISEVGNVVLFHKGPMQHVYSYAEFDKETRSIDLVTENGETQEIGVTVPDNLHGRLDKTKEMLIVEIMEDNSYENPTFIKFVKPIENTNR